MAGLESVTLENDNWGKDSAPEFASSKLSARFFSALDKQENQYDRQMRLEIMNYIGHCRVRGHESVDVGGNVFGVVDDFAAKLRRRHPLRFSDDETLFHQNAAGWKSPEKMFNFINNEKVSIEKQYNNLPSRNPIYEDGIFNSAWSF